MANETPKPGRLTQLTKIKETAPSRGLALAKVSVSAGAKAAGHAMGNWFADDASKPERLRSMLMSQVKLLSHELGQLKGSAMKVGQMLSMYGEHFLPAEANALLKTLQSQSPPLAWAPIEKVLKRQLKPEVLARLEIEHDALASASLGQVHRARVTATGEWLALKVQYPGVDQAIEGDIRALGVSLTLSKLIPKGPAYDELFKEVRQMLHQEVDYSREAEQTREFAEALKDDPRFVVPRVFEEFSTKRVLATSLEAGVPVDGPEVLGLPLERRNAIAMLGMELYFRELFELGMMRNRSAFRQLPGAPRQGRGA